MFENGPSRDKIEFQKKKKAAVEKAENRVVEIRKARDREVKRIELELGERIHRLKTKIPKDSIEDLKENAAEEIRGTKIKAEDQIDEVYKNLRKEVGRLKQGSESPTEHFQRLMAHDSGTEITQELDEIGEELRKEGWDPSKD